MRKLIIAVLVVAIVIGASFFVLFRETIRDVNTNVGSNGKSAVGYLDISLVASYQRTTGNAVYLLNGLLGPVHIDQHSTPPTAPASIFHPPSITTISACKVFVRLFIDGPGISSASQDTKEVTIPDSGGDVTFWFGHIYVFQMNGRYSFNVEFYASGCTGHPTRSLVGTNGFTVTFTGE